MNQPKYGHLKQLHDILHSMEKTLTYGNVSTIDFGNFVSVIFFVFLLTNIKHVNFELITYHEHACFRQQFIRLKEDRAVSLEMLMKVQMQQSIFKEKLMLSRLGPLAFYQIAKLRFIILLRFVFFLLHSIIEDCI